MKRITLIIAGLLLAASAATAQTNSRWGITAGANFNEIHFKQNDIMPSERMWGPQLGVTAEMNFSGIGFGVEGSALYTLKQGKLGYGDRVVWSSQGIGTETVAMHFLDVPLHLKFKYNRLGGTESTIMPMVFVGPQFSFLLHGSHGNLNTYPPVHVYLDMGLGCELFERWQLRAGYNFSVGQTFHTKILDDNIAKNRTWYVNLTYFLK
ncbi:MAG: outer membrane beta-barrel protein [Muribaculaceae bacterium]|nr:outer membrane beta-barrel protein [Muribaculaceae bacterium]MBQ7204617.1 outer membrane beta-barrel protein [Muribaculaceae bacterium]